MGVRLTGAAWQLLQRLQQADSRVTFCQDWRCALYHFELRSEMKDVVRSSTVDALDRAGLLKREPTEQARYSINERGMRLLRGRGLIVDVESGDVEVVESKLLVVAVM